MQVHHRNFSAALFFGGVVAGLAACALEPRDEPLASTSLGGLTTVDAGTDGGAGSVDTSGDGDLHEDDSDATSWGGSKFDVLPPDTTGIPGGSGGGDVEGACQKIDFLFIIDNSGSMGAHQKKLLDNFGPFIDTIVSSVAAHDYHVMVLDTDACPTDYQGNCDFSSCEQMLGAGQVRNCAVPGGRRYLTSEMSHADLKNAFSCVANVGTDGSPWEMPMNALVEGVTTLNQAGKCNTGFLRHDAVLVVTIISDDHPGWFGDDNVNGFGGTPQQWYEAVVAAKAGIVENIVMLGLIALPDDQSCLAFGPNHAQRFIDFFAKFGSQGLVGSVCDPNYNAFFKKAVGLIDGTCNTWQPAG